jgi:chromosome segregation protein
LKLKQIKLAGFKTFVDPTTIKVDSQLAGIVGPNGCGKSNVTESIKWVLGSSSAKELRGGTMEDVIFYGSDTRQPISRASVELFFDNAQGMAPQAWSSYAEISVKRVIEKEKGSSYFINNTQVRRKDVADLFLGTGLGAKGYAIIGQNTVSQIIEAKPEELKNFLEEAAGVSQYKERRKETEYRLRDTKENLSRVEDLLREINQQITRLESQAETASKYNKHQENLKFQEAQVWALKKRDANESWDQIKALIVNQQAELDQFTTALREIEVKVENARQEHANTSNEINSAQAKFYEVNALVSDAENALNNIKNNLERLKLTVVESEEKLKSHTTSIEEIEKAMEENQNFIQIENEKLTQHQQNAGGDKASLVEVEAEFRASVEKLELQQSENQKIHELINLELTRIDYINKSVDDLEARKKSLHEESLKIKATEPNNENVSPSNIGDIDDQITMADQELAEKKQLLDELERETEKLNLQKEEHLKRFQQTEIQIETLSNFVDNEITDEATSEFLNKVGIDKNRNIFKKVNIEKGWERAFGFILSEYASAYENKRVTPKSLKEIPTNIAVVYEESSSDPSTPNKKLTPIQSKITSKSPNINDVLTEWLCHTYITNDEDLEGDLRELKFGEILIDQSGNIHGKNFQVLRSESRGNSNKLTNLKLLEDLRKDLPSHKNALDTTISKSDQHADKLANLKNEVELLSDKKFNLIEEKNSINLEVNKLQQIEIHKQERVVNIDNELTETEKKISEFKGELNQKQDSLVAHKKDKIKLQNILEELSKKKNILEQKFESERETVVARDKIEQELIFNLKIHQNKHEDFIEKLNLNTNEKSRLEKLISDTHNQLNDKSSENHESMLKESLQEKEGAEKRLIRAREELVTKEANLKNLESARLEKQHSLNPLTEKLQESKIQEREAQILFEQCCQEIEKTSFEESALLDAMESHADVDSIIEKCESLRLKMERLGPVNQAAIDELNSIQERKNYLQRQSDDLTEAMTTLENAIKKIDSETREKLDATYKEVNKNFSEFFKRLFMGGKAELQLLGDEILDTGLQVSAQPPGKKNTTINLLSGGEKALTAISLIFALFKLNPSPFCVMDEVDAPLDDTNTGNFCSLVKEMADKTQFLIVTHNRITMEIAEQLIGVTQQELGVSRVVEVDMRDIDEMELAY